MKKRIKAPANIAVIPNSIKDPQQDVSPGGKDTKPGTLKQPCILSLGRLVSQKRPELIIAIANETREKLPDVTFYMAGEGSLQTTLEREIGKRGLEKRVILLGYRKDALELIREADVMLSTSSWEGLPYSILEAMALGKPVVASDIEGHRPLIQDGETGYLIGEKRDYVERLILLLKDPLLRERMGKNARQYFERHYSFDEFLAKMKDLYLDRL